MTTKNEPTPASTPAAIVVPEIVGVQLGALYLGVPEPTFRKLLKTGAIPSTKGPGGKYEIRREDIDKARARVKAVCRTYKIKLTPEEFDAVQEFLRNFRNGSAES